LGSIVASRGDAAHDNKKAVADSPALIAARNEASARLRAFRSGNVLATYEQADK
jgi:hypothetical protein